MAISFDYTITSELTFILQPGEYKYLDFSGVSSTSIISIHLMDITGSCIVQSAQESNIYFSLPETTHETVLWEFIKISGVTTPEIVDNIYSQSFRTPSALYIENTSSPGQRVKISVRSNR